MAVPIRHAVSAIVRGRPSPVQAAAMPDAVAGRDLLAVAPTGSGKTLVFAVALAHGLAGAPSSPGRPRAVVVAPTRELALQSGETIAEIGAAAGLRVATFVGGRGMSRDRRDLVAPVDVVVGTPGRLVDLIRARVMITQDVRKLVLDEADHLLGPSFEEQTSVLLRACTHASLVATTATADPAFESRLTGLRPDLRSHRVSAPIASGAPGVDDTATDPRRLMVITTDDPDGVATALAARCTRALFFVPRRDAVERLCDAVAAIGVPVAGVTGTATPTRRAAAFADLASGAVRVLVSTDLSGRGLDLESVRQIVHVGVPRSVEDLVHRSGRTGRGGVAAGVVAAVVRPSESVRIGELAAAAGMTVEVLEAGGPTATARLTESFGPEISPPRRRRSPAPPARSRRPATTSRPHRPKRKRRS